MGFEDSLKNDAPCRCGHYAHIHDGPGGQCVSAWGCPCKAYIPQRAPKEPEEGDCAHPNKQYTGAYYDGPGGRKTWLYYTCPDCKKDWREEEAPEEPEEPHKCTWGAWHPYGTSANSSGGALQLARICACGAKEVRGDLCGYCDAGLPMACACPPEAAETPCTCGTREYMDGELVHAEGCPAGPEEECCGECGAGKGHPWCGPCLKCAPEEDPYEGEAGSCGTCPSERPEGAQERGPGPLQAPSRRPPYAVAYAVQSGAQYEVLVSGDATVVAEDGVLKVVHGLPGFETTPVLGITCIRPVVTGPARKEGSDAVPADQVR